MNLVLLPEDEDDDDDDEEEEDRFRWTFDENPKTARRGTTVASVLLIVTIRMPMH